LSFGLHFVLLHVDFMNTVFSVCQLTVDEWWTVMKISLPVILLDETLKFVARNYIDVVDPNFAKQLKKNK